MSCRGKEVHPRFFGYHARQLDWVSRETYGLAKEEARHHGYTGQRGYHPLLA